MARVTVEDCIVQVPNRFELVMYAAQRARDISAGAQITLDRDRDKNPVVALREIAESKLDHAALKDSLIQGMQKHADIDKPEEVNEMAELEQELAAALAQGGAEAAQPKALPMADGWARRQDTKDLHETRAINVLTRKSPADHGLAGSNLGRRNSVRRDLLRTPALRLSQSGTGL